MNEDSMVNVDEKSWWATGRWWYELKQTHWPPSFFFCAFLFLFYIQYDKFIQNSWDFFCQWYNFHSGLSCNIL